MFLNLQPQQEQHQHQQIISRILSTNHHHLLLPSAGASASSNPLGSAADIYLVKNYIAASTQHLADRLTNIDKNQRLIAEAQANHLGPTNTLIQQAFLNVDARQAASFSASSSTVINRTVIYATGGNGGPKPPPPPGAGAVKMTANVLPPNMQIPEVSSFIGTPRRRAGERAPRGESSRSASVRGRPCSIKPLIKPPEIEVTPTKPIPAIKNIGMEEIRVKREASVKRDSSEPPKAKARPKPKAIAKAQLMIADAEPAKKREAEDILGAAAKKKFIEQEDEVKAPPPTQSKKAAPPEDSSAAASSSGPAPKAKAKAKGLPKKEPIDTSAAPVSKGENMIKQEVEY